MFHEAKVLDAQKHLKKIISVKELSRRHWMNFEKSRSEQSLPRAKKKRNH